MILSVFFCSASNDEFFEWHLATPIDRTASQCCVWACDDLSCVQHVCIDIL